MSSRWRRRDACAVPGGYVHEGSSLYLRLAATPGSEKMRFVEGTREACFVLCDLDGGSWSVIATGPPVSSNADGFDRPRIDREFGRLRIFDEPVESVEVSIHELRIESLTGRKTGG